MIERKKNRMYTSKRKNILGGGFMDTLRGIGSYIYQNKDLLAKPMLSAVGDLGGLALTEVGKATMKKIINKKSNEKNSQPSQLSIQSQQILNSLSQPRQSPIGNIIGSGIKKF